MSGIVPEIIAAAALLTALGGIWHKGILPAYRGIRAFMRTAEAAMKLVQAQLSPNGGKSLLDQVRVIQGDVEGIKANVACIKQQLAHEDTRIDALEALREKIG